jgi:hypothetical protein
MKYYTNANSLQSSTVEFTTTYSKNLLFPNLLMESGIGALKRPFTDTDT